MIVITMFLFFPFNLYSGDRLHISLGDNYGKHAMVIDGKPAGIQKDLLDWFFKQNMKLNVQIEAMPWMRAQVLVEKTKQSDGYFTAYTKTRVDVLKLVTSKNPFYITTVKMHTWKGNPKIAALSQLKSVDDLLRMDDIQHIFLRGSGYHEEQFNDAKLTYRLNSIRQIPKYLLDLKRADVFVEQSELFYPVAEEVGLIDKIQTLENIKFKRLHWHLYIRPDSKYVGLMNEIDEALARAIADGTLLAKVEEIFAKYGLFIH
jgi:ABC-type amino acid transport substrate-binding protein